MGVPQFLNNSLFEGHMHSFQSGVIMKKVSMNTQVQVPEWKQVFIILE